MIHGDAPQSPAHPPNSAAGTDTAPEPENGTQDDTVIGFYLIARQAYLAEKKRAEALEDEIERLRQGIWDAYRILGFDTDENPTPAALVYPHLADLIIEAATEHRHDYDELLEETR